VRVGVVMLPTDPWPETVERARHLEGLGYDHLWTYDHLSWRRYRGRPWFAAIPWLTGLAGATSRIRLGTLVSSPNMRHPVTLAQEAVTLDHVSGGRFILGVGAGGVGFDSTVFGAEPLAPAELVARLEEFVALLARLFAEPTVSHRGTYYTVHEACVEPASVQTPRVPIAIAAGGVKSIAITASYGDAWITFGDARHRDVSPAATDEIVRAQMRRLDDACAAIGRDPATVDRIFMIGNTEERPLASVAAFDDFADHYADIGFTDLVFHHPRPDDPAWDEPEAIVDAIATTVLPRLHAVGGGTATP
jgi:alkanesulfonate monooxygenase SsuD/methylene tetrahydromethanopterin reductase-like flavin-dependent oxidoreductase (luciferase family)